MTLARIAPSNSDLPDGSIRRGLLRVFGGLAAAFETAFEIFAEADGRSAEARNRFPLAD